MARQMTPEEMTAAIVAFCIGCIIILLIAVVVAG